MMPSRNTGQLPMTEAADWYRSTLNLAKRLHGGQVDRGGRPYWRHLENVARALVERWPDATKSEIQAALLHDALEDTSATAADLRTQGIPADVIAIVQRLTRDPTVPYQDFIRSIAASGNLSAIRVKLADNADNSDPARIHPDSAAMLAETYRPAKRILDAALPPNPAD
jgi:(p)ppGpp synthase/HD superfamily hydrolase